MAVPLQAPPAGVWLKVPTAVATLDCSLSGKDLKVCSSLLLRVVDRCFGLPVLVLLLMLVLRERARWGIIGATEVLLPLVLLNSGHRPIRL
jgi:hypothetical protein